MGGLTIWYSINMYSTLKGFPGVSAGESACNTEDLGMIPGLRRSSVEGKSYPLQYSGLENSVDCIIHGIYYGLPLWLSRLRIRLRRGRPGFNSWVGKILWRREGLPIQYSGLESPMDCIVHKLAKSQTRLSNFHFHVTISNPGNPPVSDPPQQHFSNCYFLED